MWRSKGETCFVEEIFLINLYGDSSETHLLEKYLSDDVFNKEGILRLASSIKQRVKKVK